MSGALSYRLSCVSTFSSCRQIHGLTFSVKGHGVQRKAYMHAYVYSCSKLSLSIGEHYKSLSDSFSKVMKHLSTKIIDETYIKRHGHGHG